MLPCCVPYQMRSEKNCPQRAPGSQTSERVLSLFTVSSLSSYLLPGCLSNSAVQSTDSSGFSESFSEHEGFVSSLGMGLMSSLGKGLVYALGKGLMYILGPWWGRAFLSMEWTTESEACRVCVFACVRAYVRACMQETKEAASILDQLSLFLWTVWTIPNAHSISPSSDFSLTSIINYSITCWLPSDW